MSETPNVLEAARDWIHRGFFPLPIPYREKNPGAEGRKGWQSLRIDMASAPQYFNGTRQNIGLLLGSSQKPDDPGVPADADLDCPEALRVASAFLPPTGLIFGRESKPRSHFLYRCAPGIPSKKYVNPLNTKETLVELRCQKSDGDIGMQTVVPPSTHKETGEPIRFEPGLDGEPALVDAAVLQIAISKTAAASLLVRYWPEKGRHACELALAGTLARAGWKLDDALLFVATVYRAVPTHDPAALGRVAGSVRDTYSKLSTNAAFTGLSSLAEHVGKDVAGKVAEWLVLRERSFGESPRTSPDLAEAADGNDGIHPEAVSWRERLIYNPDTKTRPGSPKPILANAITALRLAPEWRGVLAYDEFALRAVALKPAPWPGAVAGSRWTDNDDRLTANWLQHRGILVGVEEAGRGVQTVAMEAKFHPVRQYLDGLEWDGVKRIEGWLTRYGGAPETRYTAAIGSRFLISAVARIYRPGVKADCMLILEAKQGALKSTALATLAGEWFTDQIGDLNSKDAAMQCHGVWIVEMAELDSLNRSESGRIKAFMSQTFDRFRLPYGKQVETFLRDCVFAGTVNHANYLKDETGARRFWPVSCTRIDIDALRRDRDQLWAEAVHAFRGGAKWWLDTAELNQDAELQQAERYDPDAWDELISGWMTEPTQRYDATGHPILPFTSTPESVTVTDILLHAIGKRPEQWTQGDQNRVVRVLKAMDWERSRRRVGALLEWVYRRRP